MPSNDVDAVCMQRLRDGDDLALNELMTRWQGKLVRYINSYVLCEADALDIAQETFVRIYQSRHRYEPRASFATWLLRIAANLCRNHHRWRQRHPTATLDADEESGENFRDRLPGPEPPAHEVLASRERTAAVRRAIATLPEQLREVILLFGFEDLSHADIAIILNCSAKAVETRLYRARQILKDKLAALNCEA